MYQFKLLCHIRPLDIAKYKEHQTISNKIKYINMGPTITSDNTYIHVKKYICFQIKI